MKTVILAGGLGTRISEETSNRPKPMIEIGGKPLLWHLMTLYARAGFHEFVVAAGYKQEIVKQYFHHFFTFSKDFSVDLLTGEAKILPGDSPDWKVHVIDTGLNTLTGGRLKRLRKLIGNETFMCTYGDGLASVDIADVLKFHRSKNRIATLTAVRPPARFGCLELDGDRVATFAEKSQSNEGWINGGFFVFEPEIFDRIDGDATLLEHEPLAGLARDGELNCYRHEGFWQPMDTLRDKRLLEDLWETGSPPWGQR